jgi:hypothetical protein
MSHRGRRTTAVFLALAASAGAVLAGDAGPVLAVDGELRTETGVAVTIPVGFAAGGHTITTVVFSLDLDLDRLGFDPADGDGDGVPDRVRFPQGAPPLTIVDFDAADEQGELDFLLANLSGFPLPEGVLVEIEAEAAGPGYVASWIRFSRNPPPSFGDDQGQSVPGTAVVLGVEIFADGFESGDLCGWDVDTGGSCD